MYGRLAVICMGGWRFAELWYTDSANLGTVRCCFGSHWGWKRERETERVATYIYARTGKLRQL